MKTLYYNANIISLNKHNKIYKEILINDNIIEALGNNNEIFSKVNDSVKKIDLKGKTIIPGFFESHMHLVEGGRTLIDFNAKNIDNFKDFKEQLIHYAFETPYKWILSSGFDENKIFDGNIPTRKIIDEIVLNKPVCMVKEDGHCLVLNSLAIEELGLSKDKKYKDANRLDDNSLSGIFYEEDVFVLMERIQKKLPKDYFKQAIKKANKALISQGVTSINDILTNPSNNYHLYKELYKNKELDIRIFASPYGHSKMSKFNFDLNRKKIDKFLKIGPTKYFLDGSFGSKTAYLSRPYNNASHTRGRLTIDINYMKKEIKRAFKNNQSIAVHAIGDEALSVFLDIYYDEYKNYEMNTRSRVEHLQIIKDEDINRFKMLNLIASFQPIFNLQKDLNINSLGEERLKDSFRFNSFVKNDIKIIFNSDWPFNCTFGLKRDDGYEFLGFEPLLGIYLACNDYNLNKDENTSLYDAIRAYIKTPCYANFVEDLRGSLEKGKLADMVILDNDIINVDKKDIKNIKVLQTIIDGKVVYKRDDCDE